MGGYGESIELDVQGAVLAQGIDLGYNQNPTTSGSATLTLNVGGTVAAGTYVLTVLGSTGPFVKTAELELVVIE